MPFQTLASTIAQATTTISLTAVAMFGLSWTIGYLLRGSPIPFRDWKEFGNGLQQDAIKATFMLALYSSIASLISWIVSAIAQAGR